MGWEGPSGFCRRIRSGVTTRIGNCGCGSRISLCSFDSKTSPSLPGCAGRVGSEQETPHHVVVRKRILPAVGRKIDVLFYFLENLLNTQPGGVDFLDQVFRKKTVRLVGIVI